MSTSALGSAMVSAPTEPQTETPLFAAHEVDLVEGLGLPLSTYRACVSGGKGPRTFKLGRRNYVLLTDWHAWLETLAETGGLTVGCQGDA